MRDTVIILSFDRPEMLTLCLERLAACDGICEKQVWVSQDTKPFETSPTPAPETLQEIQQVIQQAAFGVRYIQRETRGGNNGENTVLALREGHATGADRIFLIEDDVLVNRDLFSFCHRALQQFEPMPVVCCRGVARSLVGSKFADDPLSLHINNSDFKQLAVAFGRDNLGTFLHGIHPRPDTQFDRQMEGTFSVIPFLARARDIGRYSSIHVNAANEDEPRPLGTLEEKIAEIRRRYSVEPVEPTSVTEVAEMPELVLRLDTRRRVPQSGFKLIQRKENGRLIGEKHWTAENYADDLIRRGIADEFRF